jgi:hypothetical protein
MSGYENKPGTGSALKNTRKEKDTQPDWRGDLTTPDGQKWEFALWEGQTRTGIPRMSIKVSEPFQPQQGGGSNYQPRQAPQQSAPRENFTRDDLDDSVPF